MKYWLTTDTHLGHTRMEEVCNRPSGFETKIFNAWRDTIKEGDVLIHLGDVCIGQDEYWHKSHVQPFKFKKWLVLGNHDSKSKSWYLSHGWDCAVERIWFDYGGFLIEFSHVPQKDTGYDFNIHGHFHNSEHRRHERELVSVNNDKQILICLDDLNYLPVDLNKFLTKWKKDDLSTVRK